MVRVVVISDTHNRHEKFDVPPGDVLIHCGDMTNRGSAPELADVNAWFGRLPHPHKVVVCGNMDQRLESCRDKAVRQNFLSNAMYLEDEPAYIMGLRVYGSPYTPKYCGAFQLASEAEAKAKWATVPDNLDVLITHGPPHGILDSVGNGIHAGCTELRQRVNCTLPRFHVFGHIHEEGGHQLEEGGVIFANAAQHVLVFEIEPRPVTASTSCLNSKYDNVSDDKNDGKPKAAKEER